MMPPWWIRICVYIGHLFFGFFFFQSLFVVLTQNTFIDLFPFRETKACDFVYAKNSNVEGGEIIKYSYEVASRTYRNELDVNIVSFNEKVGTSHESIIVRYNTVLPFVNYIKGWKLDSAHIFAFILFLFFYAFFVFMDAVINRQNSIWSLFKNILTKNKTTANKPS